ncbi:MAG: hypothetical protein J7K20_07620, partial [Thermodesulfobacterium sp.]|nr:hypothetical protein [Thermodesulfobacterium sp.]
SLQSSYNLYKLIKEKEALEKILKKEVLGVRFHCLSYAPKITSLNLEKIGFKYDTTLGFNEKVGFRNGVAFPFHLPIYDLTFSSVLELPLVIQDGSFFDFLNIDVNNALNIILKTLETVKKYNGFITILWHPTLTKVDLCNRWFEVYKEILGILKAESCFVGTCRDIYEWWKKRENDIFLSNKF